MGLEPTLDLFIDHLVEIFREARRVLHPSGTLWVNMGDSYAASRGSQAMPTNTRNEGAGTGHGSTVPIDLKPKDLMGVPWRVALALQADGWWLRSDIIWCKGLDRSEQELEAQAEVEAAIQAVRQEAGGSLFGLSKELDQALNRAEKAIERVYMVGAAMPESVKDRVTAAHEYLFVLAKEEQYFWDKHAIRVGSVTNDGRKPYGSDGAWEMDGRNKYDKAAGQPQKRDSSSRNARTVWRVQTKNHRPFILPSGEVVAHFASFPRALPARAIKAGTPEHGVCATCGAPFERIIKPTAEYAKLLGQDWADYEKDAQEGRGHSVSNQRTTKRGTTATAQYYTAGWEPTCECHGARDLVIKVTCPKCRGLGRDRKTSERQDDHMPEVGQRESKSRGHVANVGCDSVQISGDPCPECDGAGQVDGMVWDPEVIKAWPIKPAVVLDMFMGTGQTALAALDLERDVVGIDLSEAYCRLSRARCEAWPTALPEKIGKTRKNSESEFEQIGFDDLLIPGFPY